MLLENLGHGMERILIFKEYNFIFYKDNKIKKIKML